MSSPDPALRPLARHLLETEAQTGGEPLAAAAEEVFRKLRDRLIELVGVRGFEALLRRALSLARAEAPALASVEVTLDDGLAGLSSALGRQSASEADEAAACLLACFLELLATFIGAELTSRIVAGIQRVDGEVGRASEDP